MIAITDGAGDALDINSYGEYGIPGSANAGRFQYTGQAWLREVSLYHYKARAYSPTLGWFLQTDPILFDGGMNLYAYVGNDPVNFIDPTGLGWMEGNSFCFKTWDEMHIRNSEGMIVEVRLVNPQIHCIDLGGFGGGPNPNDPLDPLDPLSPLGPELQDLAGRVAQCAAQQFGVDELLGLGLTAAGAPVVPKPFVQPGTSPATSVASTVSRAVFGDARFPAGVRVWAPTWVQPLRVTANVGRAVGRLVPVVGAAILIYDAASIALCAANDGNNG